MERVRAKLALPPGRKCFTIRSSPEELAIRSSSEQIERRLATIRDRNRRSHEISDEELERRLVEKFQREGWDQTSP